MKEFVKIAKTGSLADGEMMQVEVGDEQILLSKVDGELYAISDVCSHAEASLADGYLEENEVECPLHGSRFDVKTGEVTDAPADEPVERYAVRVEGDDILIGPS